MPSLLRSQGVKRHDICCGRPRGLSTDPRRQSRLFSSRRLYIHRLQCSQPDIRIPLLAHRPLSSAGVALSAKNDGRRNSGEVNGLLSRCVNATLASVDHLLPRSLQTRCTIVSCGLVGYPFYVTASVTRLNDLAGVSDHPIIDTFCWRALPDSALDDRT
jgi:hypothetical protein